MSYIHIIAHMKKKNSNPKVKEKPILHIEADCKSKEDALTNILIPYVSNSGRILIGGAIVSAADIEKISVFESHEDSKTLYRIKSQEMEASSTRMASQGVIGFFGTTLYGAIHSKAQEITNDILREAMNRHRPVV
ncbi:hypothetical protein ACMV5I_28985 [Serratia sp. T13T92]|uniref:hypothetical protein n=1 Tax=Serratia sp. T13T92 TaxID=3397496 RepID=UPI0039E18CD4